MKIIPVIDLKAGQVVHAVRGMRDQYQPIQQFSRLTTSSEPERVLQDLLQLYAFDCVYIADLDAIAGLTGHATLLSRLIQRYPDIEFWIDAGRQLHEIHAGSGKCKCVIGTESQLAPPQQVAVDYLLSLDFKQQAMGDQRWFEQSQHWPDSVIVMTLARVGSNQGPDWAILERLFSRHSDKKLIAAGGVRGIEDVQQLAEMGISGVLLASALHSGAISTEQIADFQAKKYPSKPGYF